MMYFGICTLNSDDRAVHSGFADAHFYFIHGINLIGMDIQISQDLFVSTT